MLWELVFVVGAGAYVALAPSYYTAVTTIVLDEQLVRRQNDGERIVSDPAYVDTQVQVLQSNEVFTRVLDRAHKGGFGALGEGGLRLTILRLAASWGLLDIDEKAAAERALVSSLKRGLIVRRIGTSNAVDVAFTARDPNVAADIADAFAREYLVSDVEQKEAARQELLGVLRNRLAELQNKAFAPEQPERFAGQGANGADARAKWMEAQAATETYRALYNSTLQRRYAQAMEQASPGARVISAAEVPEGRSSPNTPLVGVLAVILGAAVGFAHASWRFATDEIIRTAHDLVAVSGMTPVACVPDVSSRRGTMIRYVGADPPAHVFSSSQIRDAMDRLAVRLCARATKRPTTIVGVVSPQAGAGASTLAANLALALASAGKKILFLDANWRRERSRRMDSDNDIAIAHSRLGDSECAPDVVTLRAKGLVSGAHASRRLVLTLGEVAPAYEWVVVDLNPMACSADLDAIMSDVAFVVLVVAAGQTNVSALEEAAANIPGDKKVALVLNRAPRTDVPVCA